MPRLAGTAKSGYYLLETGVAGTGGTSDPDLRRGRGPVFFQPDRSTQLLLRPKMESSTSTWALPAQPRSRAAQRFAPALRILSCNKQHRPSEHLARRTGRQHPVTAIFLSRQSLLKPVATIQTLTPNPVAALRQIVSKSYDPPRISSDTTGLKSLYLRRLNKSECSPSRCGQQNAISFT